MSVVSLAEAREAREPHLSGKARCLHCKHEYMAVSPVGVVSGLECPSCGLPKSVMVHLTQACGEVWACGCGCDVFQITRTYTSCLNCGQRQEFSE